MAPERGGAGAGCRAARNLGCRGDVQPAVQFPLEPGSSLTIRRVRAVVNPASGSVGAQAAQALEALFAEFGLDHRVTTLAPRRAERGVRAALDAGPDLVVVLGGDGTARLAAEMCGGEGPLVAPLSGGTMNMLGRALYGETPWPEALRRALDGGQVRWVSGGEVGGRAFFCGALLGAPALLAPAREAIRARALRRAWRRAVLAQRKALISRLAYEVDGASGQGVALSLRCPSVLADPDAPEGALKAAVLDPPGADAGVKAAVRLALRNFLGDWRDDPNGTTPCVSGRAWARTTIPVMLDGEIFRLGREVDFRVRRHAFRALAPAPAGT
jgi:diacylglycerol kinase family enzyme